MVFTAALLKDVFGISFARLPSVATLLYMAALLVIIYVYASTFAVITEAHTNAVRSRLGLVISALGYRIHSFGQTFVRALPVKDSGGRTRPIRRASLATPAVCTDPNCQIIGTLGTPPVSR